MLDWQVLTRYDGVAYGNGTFVAVGAIGSTRLFGGSPSDEIVTSADGVTWTSQASIGNGLSAVTFAGGSFVAVGDYRTIETSPDGVRWAGRASDGVNGLRGVTYGNGSYVAVGDGGTILQTRLLSPLRLEPIRSLPDGVFQINVTGSGGAIYGIEASTNLVDWLLLTNWVSTNTVMQFIDTGAANFNRRFYRAVLP